MTTLELSGTVLYDNPKFLYSVPYRGGEHWCRLRIFQGNSALVVLLTQPEESIEYLGLSVTNAVEHIITTAQQHFAGSEIKLDSDVIFVEHYCRWNQFICDREHDFDVVELDDDGRPQWQSLSVPKLLSLLGC